LTPSPRCNHTLSSFDKKLLLIGGINDEAVCASQDSLFVLDTSFFRFPLEEHTLHISPQSAFRRPGTTAVRPKRNVTFEDNLPLRANTSANLPRISPCNKQPGFWLSESILESDWDDSLVFRSPLSFPSEKNPLLKFLETRCIEVIDRYQLRSRIEPPIKSLDNISAGLLGTKRVSFV
jgi:hypothetical protein